MSTAIATHEWDTAGTWTEVVTVPVPELDGAEIIDLDAHRAARRPTAATYRRRRLGVIAGLLSLALSLALVLGGGPADAGLEDPVAGSHVLAPGETLWDVAAENAPAGVSTVDYLDSIRELNDFSGTSLPAWTVVLLPHH